jgi:hypothetical protein
MAGRIRKLADKIIEGRANGNQFIRETTKVKLILKGINPDKYDANSADDTVILDKLTKLAGELGVKL